MSEINSTSIPFLRFLDGLGDPVLVIDASANILHLNPAAIQFLEIKEPESAVGKSLTDYCAGLTNEGLDSVLSVCSGEWHPFLLRGSTEKEQPQLLACFATPEPGTSERLVHIRATNPVPMSVDALSIETLCSRFGHQFANLLTPMMGYIELTRLDADPSSELASLMESFMNICRRMILHVQNLLLLRPRSKANFQTVDLRDVLRDAVKISKDTGLTEEHIVKVAHLGPDEPVLIHSEGDLPLQMIVNIIVNAAESMTKPGTIDVSLRRYNDTAEIRIADTGPGMTEETRARLFEPFFSTKANGRGIGLGLYVSQIIASRHNASIRVGALQPTGTAVNIHFPIVSG